MSSTDEARTLERRVREFLRRHGIAPDSEILVAVSGGPDSICLLAVLHALKTSYPLVLRAAFLDHGIRSTEETGRDLQLVNGVCARMQLDLAWKRLPQGFLEHSAGQTGASLEENARRERYRYLESLARPQEYIAVGHTADDQVETVVMRFFQGSGLGGLPGIPPVRKRLIRPLIHCTREQILRYLGQRELPYRNDSTNRDTRYLRNAVRRDLLPAVERVFPGFRSGVLSYAGKLAEMRSFARSEADRRLAWKPVSGGYGISGRVFLSAPALLRLFSLTGLMNTMLPRQRRIPHRFLAPIADAKTVRARRVVLRGYGMRLYWRGKQLILSADVVAPTEKGYFIEEIAAGRVWVPEAGLVFDFGSPVRDTDRRIFRSARIGDRISIRGGSKTVRKLFCEWQVSEGWKIPIVETKSGIVAVLGSFFGGLDRFRAGMSNERGKALKSMVHRYDVEVE